MRLIFLVLFMLGTGMSFGQTLLVEGTVTDSEFNPLEKARITNKRTGQFVHTDSLGNFWINAKVNDTLKTRSDDFQSRLTIVPKGIDTIRLSIVLSPDFTDYDSIGEVVISRNRIQTVVHQFSRNVIDYVPFKDFILTLTSYKSKQYLSLEGTDTTYLEYPIEHIKALSFFEDCYGNIHLMTADSAHQIWLEDQIKIIASTSLKEFDQYIRPCVAAFDSILAFEQYTNHRKRYLLSLAQQTDQQHQRKFVYQSWDRLAEKVAQQEYYSVLAFYHQHCPLLLNKIINGIWDGDVNSLSIPGIEGYGLEVKISWYDKIRAKPLNVFSFQMRNYVLCFDLSEDSIVGFSPKGSKVLCSPFAIPEKLKSPTILQDKHSNRFYLQYTHKGIRTLSKINLSNGQQSSAFQLKEVPFAKDLQIFDDWLYFRKAENGFHRLYRIKLKSNELLFD